jgi:hypothetical protein
MNLKITNIKIFLLCPIPEEQKPIHEYLNLRTYFQKENNLNLLKSTSKNDDIPMKEIKKSNIFLKKILSFFLLFRWKEVEKRLNLSSVFYEEASWYDGQIWEKPFSILKNDRLLNTQRVRSHKR